ncbi:hypothetical protein [Massilia sp. Mn16-1_5]|uniref:FimV/HubP-related protein n=1 Tax=Massilia sp. Mn16-1_5 TaxID=2079199 RepID=UPI00109E492D|nr:hypothetical protein [Massilia sp. Mn16-1_5]
MALRSSTLLSTLLLAAAVATGHAAELGEAQVRSYIGQALVADVELNLIEEPGTPVKVRLANPDVYRGANIAMPPVLSSLNMTVTRRDGRQFLHLTSLKPVESRHLHVYLELVDGGQRSVRLVTLWLTPDPHPAPPPVPEAPKVQAEPAPLPVPVRKPVPVPAARPAAALQAGEEYVEAPAVVRKPLPKAVPAVKKAPPNKPAPVHAAPAEAPSCAPQPASEHLNACVALGEKNAALRQDLGKLEEKVKALQGAAKPVPVVPSVQPVAPVVPAAAHEAAPAKPHEAAPAPAVKEAPKNEPKGAPRIHRKPKKAEPPEPELPWLPIGAASAAVLAIAGLVLALLRRRKRAGIGKIQAAHKPAKLPKAGKDATVEEGEPKPKFMEAVKARLMPGRAKGPVPEAVTPAEPVLTDVISHPE